MSAVIKARLNSLRKNLPTRDVEHSVVDGFNNMVEELETQLSDPEIGHFKVSSSDVKPLLVQVIPGRGATYTDDKYCNHRVFKQQVEGLWEYLVDSGVIKADVVDAPKMSPSSGDIHIHGSVTGSVIQQGSQNTAILNYQADVQKVLDEIRPTLNAAKLSAEAKQELKADFDT